MPSSSRRVSSQSTRVSPRDFETVDICVLVAHQIVALTSPVLGGAVFMRFKRVKTATQQGVSLFKDPQDFFTCPLHVLGVAMALQVAPGSRIFPQFAQSAMIVDDLDDCNDDIGLLDLLEMDEHTTPSAQGDPTKKNKPALPGAHAFVNRLLRNISKIKSAQEGGLTTNLSSHSFRRGGAMHANADGSINSLWVVERGGWNTSRVSKAFSYMLGTSRED